MTVRLMDGFGEAFATLRAHPLRTSLAIVAMAGAVSTMTVVQSGLRALERATRAESARTFGADSFILVRVAAAGLSRKELGERLARHPNITRSDGRFLERVAGDDLVFAATAQRSADISARGRTTERASVTGTQAALFEIRALDIERGRPFSRSEELQAAQVAVLGHEVADELFGLVDPIGRVVRIGGRAFRVVGVQARQGGPSGAVLDRYVWIPLPAFERVFGAAASLQIYAAGRNIEPDAAEDRARIAMRARRHLAPGRPDTFDVLTPEAARGFVAALTGRVGAAAMPISLMALLGAVVVIANTTLVSVSQRTREVGIRRALGATRQQIVVETLAESTLIAGGGALSGIAAAAAVLPLVGRIAGAPAEIEPLSIAGALAASVAAGLAAGWVPARRAIGVDVVVALGEE